MPNRTSCTVEGCSKPTKTAQLCGTHYNAQLRQNTLDNLAISWEKVAQIGWTSTETECWEFNGVRVQGYGYYRGVRVPRLSYTYHHGPIPPGLHIRHKCDNPPCLNPDHLEVGTYADNSRDAVERGRAKGHRQTHCSKGHPLTGDNDRGIGRPGRCRECNRTRKREWARANKFKQT